MRKQHQKLFEKHCKHKEEYDKIPGVYDWSWNSCSDCILRKIPFMVEHSKDEIERDVCFAIWHNREGRLKQRTKRA